MNMMRTVTCHYVVLFLLISCLGGSLGDSTQLDNVIEELRTKIAQSQVSRLLYDAQPLSVFFSLSHNSVATAVPDRLNFCPLV